MYFFKDREAIRCRRSVYLNETSFVCFNLETQAELVKTEETDISITEVGSREAAVPVVAVDPHLESGDSDKVAASLAEITGNHVIQFSGEEWIHDY